MGSATQAAPSARTTVPRGQRRPVGRPEVVRQGSEPPVRLDEEELAECEAAVDDEIARSPICIRDPGVEGGERIR
jgi:hypothetical protein